MSFEGRLDAWCKAGMTIETDLCRTVADLWRAIDSISPAMQVREIDATPVKPRLVNPRLQAMTDEQLLDVITEGGATLVLYQDGSQRVVGKRRELTMSKEAQHHGTILGTVPTTT
jgi:hypothetical protein